MHKFKLHKDRAWKPHTKYLLTIAATIVVSTAFTLAVIWYPMDQTEISRTVEAIMGKVPDTATPKSVEADADGPPPEAVRDHTATPDVAGLDAEEADVGFQITREVIEIAQNKNVTDTAIRGELKRRIDNECVRHGGCDERESDALELLMESTLAAHIVAAKDDVAGNAEWVGRVLLAAGEDDSALDLFVDLQLTPNTRTLLVDMMDTNGGNCRLDEGFARTMAEYATTNLSSSYAWPYHLRLLIDGLSPSEAADVRYALRGYISCLRHGLTMSGPDADIELLIARLDVIEQDKQH